VGAVVADAAGRPIGEGRNLREAHHDPTAHAEVIALRAAAAATGSWNLEGCTLVVTLEPCLMCAGALLQARISRVVFGAWDDKAGAVGSMYDVVRDRRLPVRAEVIGGVRAEAATQLLKDFFADRR
jgi:tRNA(adenine34) deaminase